MFSFQKIYLRSPILTNLFSLNFCNLKYPSFLLKSSILKFKFLNIPHQISNPYFEFVVSGSGFVDFNKPGLLTSDLERGDSDAI